MARYNYNLLPTAMLSITLLLVLHNVQAQTKIGGTAGPGDASAVLELQSTEQGFLHPRMTTTQRDNINNPATGLTIYNTTTNCIQVYKGVANGGWHDLCNTTGAFVFANCSTPVITGTFEATKAATATIQLSYTNNTGQVFGAFVSGTVNGITLTAPGGNVTPVTAGSGSITLTASGTPDNAGNFNIPIVLAGTACNIPITVDAFQGNVPVACGTAPGCSGGVNPATAVAGDKICWGGFEYIAVSAGSRLWFDRNLGASRVPVSETDASGLGDLYQWGRTGDGHQCRNSQTVAGPLTTANLSIGAGKFITVTVSPFDWITPQNGTLWNNTASGGVNNPCPPGWRVPAMAEIFGALSGQNPWTTSVLKVPQSGYREYNSAAVAAGFGGLRVVDLSGTLGYILQWSSGNTINASHQNANSGRGWGWPVRCTKH